MDEAHTEDTVQLAVAVPRSLQKSLRVQAVLEERSMRQIVTEALLDYLAQHQVAPALASPAMGPVSEAPPPAAQAAREGPWHQYHLAKNKAFLARGDLRGGFELKQSGRPRFDAGFIEAALDEFAGQTVVGGFNMTAPPRGGFGAWVERNSQSLNSRKLTPRHACFLAGILNKEAGVELRFDGPHRRVMLKFPARSPKQRGSHPEA